MTPFQITNQAVEQVKYNNKVYCEKLCAFAEDWVKKQMKQFTADDLKKAYFEAGNPPPATITTQCFWSSVSEIVAKQTNFRY